MKQTKHTLHFRDSRDLSFVPDESVHLVVTSPPYPMIGMWDAAFSSFSPAIKHALECGDGMVAFGLMHAELDKIWAHAFRALKPGGFLCVNVGDATSTRGGMFRLFSNHARIALSCTEIGFSMLPLILWWKPTNAPNKFMGSGMLPAGAYVTLEHEFILIFRKGGKREFRSAREKALRNESALFWEERNIWFSDHWDLKGQRQGLWKKGGRDRSAAFPFELAYRLINMYSVKGDTVLDPFLGTGTTMLAAIASGRNSIGVEIDGSFKNIIGENLEGCVPFLNDNLHQRIARHINFVSDRHASGKEIKYLNRHHQFRVVTRQEVDLKVETIASVEKLPSGIYKTKYKRLSAGTPSPESNPADRSDQVEQTSLFS